MSDEPAGSPGPGREPHVKRPPEGLLVSPRRPITRYRPAAIAAGLAGVVLVVGAGFMVGLGQGQARRQRDAAPAAPSVEGPSPIEDRLPARYDEAAALPPPVGEPRAGGAAPYTAPAPSSPAARPASPALERARQAAIAARASAPFFPSGGGQAPARSDPALGASPAARADPAAAPGAAVALTPREAFIAAAAAPAPRAPILPRPPLSPYEVKAGALIAAALVTGVNSDLPGPVIAQVTEPVFDHRTGRTMLIPQGARLIGRYDSAVGYGQARLLVVWTQIVFPSGRSVDLGAMVGLDATGMSGLAGQTDRHLPGLARAIGLSSLISIGGADAQNSAGRSGGRVVVQDAAGGVAASASQTGQRLVERDLQRPPTLRLAPGQRVRVLIDRDLVLPPEDAPSP